MFNRIAFAKIGWGETYTGEEIKGRHDYIKQGGNAHERFNFKLGPGKRYYGYLPPIGARFAVPKPDPPTGWLVIFVAAEKGTGPLRPVGWYCNARFEADWQDRPEYKTNRRFEHDKEGGRYFYVVSAAEKDVHFIPVEFRRQFRVPGAPHFKQAPFLYALAPGYSERWRKTYAELAKKIVKSPPKISGAKKPHGHGFPDPAVGAKVEKAAITAARHLLAGMTYDYIRSREDECCGYDLFASSSKRRTELHVEVKGTQASDPWFMISANEKGSAEQDPKWRLVMVTNALNSPSAKLMTWPKVKKQFRLEPIGWVGYEK